jgi:hypothetical protein
MTSQKCPLKNQKKKFDKLNVYGFNIYGSVHRKYIPIYRVIQNDCRGFNNLSYTTHLREEYVVVPMDREIL